MFSKRLTSVSIIRYFSNQNIVKSRAKPVQIPKVSLQEYLWENLDKWADKTAVICAHTRRKFTFYDIYKKSLALAHFFREKAHLKEGDTVGIVLPNVPEFPIVLLGAIQAGLRVTTCNPAYTSHEIIRQMRDCQTKLIITSDDLTPKVEDTNLKTLVINSNEYEGITNSNESFSLKTPNLDDVPLLLYSSGTTGLPKGVQISHRNIVANLAQADSAEFSLASENGQDVVPSFLPYFHIYALSQIVLLSLRTGRQTVAVSHFSSQNFLHILKNFRPTLLYTVPLMINMMITHPQIKKEDLKSLNNVVCGAAPLGALDVQKFNEKTDNAVNLIQSYGMTEASPLVLLQTKKLDHGFIVGGAGLLVPNTEAKVIPLDGKNSDALPPKTTGELILRGPQVMKGYLNNTEANENAFIEGNWLRTGDVGHYDENGHFFITDRLKELIKVKGFQVAPAELEEILRDHPDVEDAAVVGVPHVYLGEAPRAFVVLKKEARTLEGDIKEFVAKNVAKYKRLEGGVIVVDKIPKNPSGKILRRQLKEHSN